MYSAMRPSASVTNESSLEIRQVEQGSKIVSVPSGTTCSKLFVWCWACIQVLGDLFQQTIQCSGSLLILNEYLGDTMVVVQLPRGNLETFHPRLLVLWSIADQIDRKNYLQAWEVATTNRVNLNILVDYKWPLFLQNTNEFVHSIQREEVVCSCLGAPKLISYISNYH